MSFINTLSTTLAKILPDTTFEAIAWVTIALCAYTIGLGIYRLYLCPHARFPGPSLAALTYWYEYYYDVTLGGKYIFRIEELHKQYGPVVRINPYELHINDPDFFSEIYHNNKWITHRDRWYNLDHLGDGLAFTMHHDLHRERREPLAPYFSMQSIRALEPRITGVVTNMVTRMQRALQDDEVLVMYRLGTAFAMDVITEYAFGKEGATNMMLKPEMGAEWSDMTKETIQVNPFARQFKWLTATLATLPSAWVLRLNPKLAGYVHWKEKLLEQVRRIVAEHSEANDDSKGSGYEDNIFHHLLDSDLSTADKGEMRLTDEASMIVGAGGETTAQVIGRAFYHILDNPEVLVKLRAELIGAIPDAKVMPSLRTLQNLPYLSAVVEEAVRIALPLLARSPRMFEDHALQFDGWRIEPGIAVSTSPYVVSTNERVFPEPFKFRPERWLGDAGKELQKYAVTFGKGRRGCLGKNLGYVELWFALGVAFRRFELELYETTIEDVTVVHDFFIGVTELSSKGVRAKVVRELS
ncbi:uncharacterized protein HMPREF1541_07408 [Cyphellophora europaea CBS 101466]|uniref:Cytochrome P450 n=1 Tax=Cyphellophora europaea (strain CBS 101466) TaxID=1220924 RepID=W2RN71_CYPE1|nr:uncharacterized protein HMPREF1541_07408 [Cyphellophora europaea CBS 101466]ETN37785.1 hypothetical protein HMPREF1541_07408 [Cyphellophora europaea CBS 101466]